jgi:transcriptional regulator with XRE-family HTH domain
MPRRRSAAAELGSRIRARRLELGLTQEALAERAGVHTTYLGGIERGMRNPSLAKILALAAALHEDPAELVQGLKGER